VRQRRRRKESEDKPNVKRLKRDLEPENGDLSLSDQIARDLLAPIHLAFEREGITVDFLAQKVREALDAEIVRVYYDNQRGEVKYSKPLIDWKTRQKAREDVCRLLGLYP